MSRQGPVERLDIGHHSAKRIDRSFTVVALVSWRNFLALLSTFMFILPQNNDDGEELDHIVLGNPLVEWKDQIQKMQGQAKVRHERAHWAVSWPYFFTQRTVGSCHPRLPTYVRLGK
jgi:hypothetical protein